MIRAGAFCLALLSATFAFLSCAGGADRLLGEAADMPDYSGLGANAALYGELDAQASRRFLAAFLEAIGQGELVPYLGRVQTLRFAAAEGDRRFVARAYGSFPTGRMDFAFWLSPDWKRAKLEDGNAWWRHVSGLALRSSGRSLYLLSGPPPEPGAEPSLPDGIERADASVWMTGWFASPLAFIQMLFQLSSLGLRLPAFDLRFALVDAGDAEAVPKAQLRFVLVCAQEREARALAAMLNLVRRSAAPVEDLVSTDNAMSVVSRLFLSAELRVDSRRILLDSGAMDAEGLALLYSSLSLYLSRPEASAAGAASKASE